MKRVARFGPVVLLLMIIGGAAPAAAQTSTVVIPDVTGPIAATATSFPLMTSSKLQTVVDIAKAGYVEEEFFVTGRANVYDWGSDGQPVVRTPNAPYTTPSINRSPVRCISCVASNAKVASFDAVPCTSTGNPGFSAPVPRPGPRSRRLAA